MRPHDGSPCHCLNTTSRCAFADPAPPVVLHRGKRTGRGMCAGATKPSETNAVPHPQAVPHARGAMGSLVWVKSDERGERGAHCKGAETPAVYTRPRMESHARDPGQAAPAGQLRLRQDQWGEP